MNNIIIYHKDYCPYCKAALQLLSQQGLGYTAIEVTNDAVEFSNMVRRSGARTVPQIFVGDEHIGGFDDLQTRFIAKNMPFNQQHVA